MTVDEKIAIALKTLGVKGHVAIKDMGLGRYEVLLNNEYFGMFDENRNTFVD